MKFEYFIFKVYAISHNIIYEQITAMITKVEVLKLKERVIAINARNKELFNDIKSVNKLNKVTEELTQKTNKLLSKIDIIITHFENV